MKQLARQSVDIRAIDRPFAFISCAADYDRNHDHFDGDFLLWADTENAMTSVRLVPNSPLSTGAQISTAFSVMKQVPDDWRSEQSDTVLNECEELAWHIIRKIMHDANPAKLPCHPTLYHVDTDSIQMERDGPYFGNYMGVTARVTLRLQNAAPKYAPSRWTAS